MRTTTLPVLRQLRRTPSSILASTSSASASSQCASHPFIRHASTSTTSTSSTPSTPQAAAPKTPYKKPYTPRPAPKPKPALMNPMSVQDVDTSLPPLPTIAPKPTTSPGVDPEFISAVQQTSPSLSNGGNGIDWSSSFHGLSTLAFEPSVAAILMAPLNTEDIEIKPDGIAYLPEIKYRRILNTAFGPGGWGLAPRGELVVGDKVVTREYALVVHGRFVAQARGECQYFSEDTIPTAAEGCKSNALSRCCKDLGIASELWDPRFLRGFKKEHCREVWVEHVVSKKKRQVWTRKDTEPQYPYVLSKR